MSMGPYDTIQDKSFVVYVTMTDLEKMGDHDWADVRRFYYSALWDPVTFYLFKTNLVETLVECLTFSILWMLKQLFSIKKCLHHTFRQKTLRDSSFRQRSMNHAFFNRLHHE
jgi:hypothetical protein